MSVDMPEIEVHSRREDRENDKLETVYARVCYGMRSMIQRYILVEYGVVCVLSVPNISGSVLGRTGCTHMEKQRGENVRSRENYRNDRRCVRTEKQKHVSADSRRPHA
jgi:hypothetical protein